MWTDKAIYFNFGQKLAPEHLNSLSDYARMRDNLVQHILSGARGVVRGYLEELKIECSQSNPMVLVIQPGAAVLSDGELIIVSEPQLLSLQGVAGADVSKYYVQLHSSQVLEESVEDSDIPELKGYKYRRASFRIKLERVRSEDSIELASIELDSSVKKLLLSQPTEGSLGYVDQRSKPWFYSFNRHFIDYDFHDYAQKVTREFRATLVQMGTVFLNLKWMGVAQERSLLLEAELAERFFLPRKVNFLLEQTKRVLLDLLEEIRSLSQSNPKQLNEFWSEVFDRVDKTSSTSGEATLLEFQALNEVSKVIRHTLLDLTSEESKRVLIRDSLRDIELHPITFRRKHAFGGVLYQQVEQIGVAQFKDRLQSSSDFTVFRTLSSNVGVEKDKSTRAQFFSEGVLELEFSEVDKSRDAVVFFNSFKRRGSQSFDLIVNGNRLESKEYTSEEQVNSLIGVGFLIPKENLKDGLNQIALDIKKVALDFGLTDIVLYQEQGVNEI